MDWKLGAKMVGALALGMIPTVVGLAVFGSRKDKKKGNISSALLGTLAGGAAAIPAVFAARWLLSDVSAFNTAGLVIGPKTSFGALEISAANPMRGLDISSRNPMRGLEFSSQRPPRSLPSANPAFGAMVRRIQAPASTLPASGPWPAGWRPASRLGNR